MPLHHPQGLQLKRAAYRPALFFERKLQLKMPTVKQQPFAQPLKRFVIHRPQRLTQRCGINIARRRPTTDDAAEQRAGIPPFIKRLQQWQMLQAYSIGIQAPAGGLRQSTQHWITALAGGIRFEQQVQLTGIQHRLIGSQTRRLLAQILSTLGALQARIAVAVEPVCQGVDQTLRGHVVAQQTP
ncbi:hypothetical protein D3C81_1509750 [compost metagenome]